jgi:hypothetical protein
MVGPEFSISRHKARKHSHIFVNGSVGALIPGLKYERDESRSVTISGERIGISIEKLVVEKLGLLPST